MPRNSSGTYSLPAGNPVASAETISSTWANTTLADIQQALTDSLDRLGRGGMIAPFRFADGELAAPSLTWVNEPASGLYRAANQDHRYVINGTNVMRLRNTGLTFWAGGGWRTIARDDEVVKLAGTQTVTGLKIHRVVGTVKLVLRATSDGNPQSLLEYQNTTGDRIGFAGVNFNRYEIRVDDTHFFRISKNPTTPSTIWEVNNNGQLTVGDVPWARLSGVPSSLFNTVNLTGNQSIAGTKTFTEGFRVESAASPRFNNTGTTISVQLRTGAGQGTIRAYVAANNSNRYGFLNETGAWGVRWSSAGVMEVGSVPWARLTGQPTTISGYGITDGPQAFGVGVSSQNLADYTSTAANVGRIFRALSTATGGPGIGGGGISLPFGGFPTINFLQLSNTANPRLFAGFKNGASATPTWVEFASLSTTQTFTADKTFAGNGRIQLEGSAALVTNSVSCVIARSDGTTFGSPLNTFGNLILQPRTSAGSAGSIVLATGDTTPVARLVVRPNGNVGIGTIDPQDTLHVAGTARINSGSAIPINIRGSSNQTLIDFLNNAGTRVGIIGKNSTEGFIIRSGSGDPIQLQVRNAGGSDNQFVLSASHGGATEIRAGNVLQLRIPTTQATGPEGREATGSGYRSLGYREADVVTSNSNRTLERNDSQKVIQKTDGTARTYSIPTNASVPYPIGTMITLANRNATANIVVARNTGVVLTLMDGTGGDANRNVGPWGVATLLKVDTNTWLIWGSEIS